MSAAAANRRPDPYADPHIEVPTPASWGHTQMRKTALERAGYVVHVSNGANPMLRVQLPNGELPDRAVVLAILATIG